MENKKFVEKVKQVLGIRAKGEIKCRVFPKTYGSTLLMMTPDLDMKGQITVSATRIALAISVNVKFFAGKNGKVDPSTI